MSANSPNITPAKALVMLAVIMVSGFLAHTIIYSYTRPLRETNNKYQFTGMETVEYDKHLWIRALVYGKPWQPIHHPDCQCRKEEL